MHSKCELAYAAYEVEQDIILCLIDKEHVIGDKHAFISLLQKMIVTDYYFPSDTIQYNSIQDYGPIEFEIDEFLKKAKFDYSSCTKEYKSEYSSSALVRKKLDADIFNVKIESGIKLMNKWNEYQYFIETEGKYLLYIWGTSV